MLLPLSRLATTIFGHYVISVDCLQLTSLRCLHASSWVPALITAMRSCMVHPVRQLPSCSAYRTHWSKSRCSSQGNHTPIHCRIHCISFQCCSVLNINLPYQRSKRANLVILTYIKVIWCFLHHMQSCLPTIQRLHYRQSQLPHFTTDCFLM